MRRSIKAESVVRRPLEGWRTGYGTKGLRCGEWFEPRSGSRVLPDGARAVVAQLGLEGSVAGGLWTRLRSDCRCSSLVDTPSFPRAERGGEKEEYEGSRTGTTGSQVCRMGYVW